MDTLYSAGKTGGIKTKQNTDNNRIRLYSAGKTGGIKTHGSEREALRYYTLLEKRGGSKLIEL